MVIVIIAHTGAQQIDCGFIFVSKTTENINKTHYTIIYNFFNKLYIYLLHIFSLKTPQNGRFNQRKVTVPCAFSMRKGVKINNWYSIVTFASKI
jgi:hypothetical protein